MARAATVGLLIWDGESQGTLMNALRLVAQQKTAVVYVGPEKAFSEVRSRGDFDVLAHRLDDAAARRLRDRAVLEGHFETEEERLYGCNRKISLGIQQAPRLYSALRVMILSTLSDLAAPQRVALT
jgi:hypothetical protein